MKKLFKKIVNFMFYILELFDSEDDELIGRSVYYRKNLYLKRNIFDASEYDYYNYSEEDRY